MSISRKQLIVAVEGKTLSDVLSQGDKVDALANNLLKHVEIISFSSLGQVINSASVQQKVAGEFLSGLSGSRLTNILFSGLEQHGFASEPFQDHVQSLALLARARTLPVSEGIEKLANSPFRGIIERHLFQDTGGYHLLTYLNYNGPEFRQTVFLNEVQRDDPQSRVTSVDLVSGQLTDSVRHSFVWAIMTGGLMVLFLLVSHFNSPSGIFYSLFPVASGAVAMLGIMALSGMRLNFMNVMVLVTIFGMGSDYGLHVAHRVRCCAEEEYKGRFIQAGRAVLLFGLTTIAGFGSLAFTDYGALASIGWATNFGIAATTLFTFWNLPAFMTYLRNKANRRVL